MRMFKNLEDSLESLYAPLPEMFVVMSADSAGPARLNAALRNASEDSILYLAGDRNHSAKSKNYLVNSGFPVNQIRTEESCSQSFAHGTWRAYLDITRAFENFGERDITLVSDTDLLEYHVELAQKISSKHVLGVPSGYKGSLLRQGMVMLETSALLKDVSTARRNNSSLLQYYPEFTHIGPRTSHSFLQYILQLLR